MRVDGSAAARHQREGWRAGTTWPRDLLGGRAVGVEVEDPRCAEQKIPQVEQIRGMCRDPGQWNGACASCEGGQGRSP